ncbi:hypothetical protein FTUN_5890 [Frigoriglobus tundricola]|uniref:HEAT repeat domain-containing protein n=1 Tax=Frigoriglobus tundricola TaxID=2774151 RepID=A0A6M5YZF8_9BACT|nr:hypothetical protein FTUN_5890 [Frigoriglobus tundricola]
MRVSLLAVVLVIASAPALAAEEPVPKYEGKPLEYWVTRFQKAETDEQRRDAAAAIRAFGADAAPALPTFIEMLADHSPGYRAFVIDMIAAIGPKAQEARPFIRKLIQDPKSPPYGGVDAIVAISPEPKEAAQLLAPLLENGEVKSSVYRALCDIGPDAKDALPAIRRYVLNIIATTERRPGSHRFDCAGLAKLGPDVVPLAVEMLETHDGRGRDEALTCLEELGAKANKAVPSLLKLLKHDDAESRYRAAVMLWKWEKNTAAVPALASVLTAEAKIRRDRLQVESNFAADAARMLGEIGPDAKAVLPALREAVTIGIPASVLSKVYFDLAITSYPGTAVYLVSGKEKEYELHLRYQSLVTVAQAAEEAINKIEGKAKK